MKHKFYYYVGFTETTYFTLNSKKQKFTLAADHTKEIDRDFGVWRGREGSTRSITMKLELRCFYNHPPSISKKPEDLTIAISIHLQQWYTTSESTTQGKVKMSLFHWCTGKIVPCECFYPKRKHQEYFLIRMSPLSSITRRVETSWLI